MSAHGQVGHSSWAMPEEALDRGSSDKTGGSVVNVGSHDYYGHVISGVSACHLGRPGSDEILRPKRGWVMGI